ncbi:unnamed protein product, partial [Allacma fusca]
KNDGLKILNLRELSRYELFAVSVWPLCLSVSVLHVIIFLIIPSRSNFIYYNVPENLKNPVTMIGCAILEFYLMTFMLSMGLLLLGVHLLTFHMVLIQLETGMKTMNHCITATRLPQRLKETIHDEWERCRKIQLHLRIFNESNNKLQCVHVLFYFESCILMSYFGIRLILVDALFGTPFLVLGIIAAVFHVLVYEPAFGISSKMEEFKSKMTELACYCQNMAELALTKKRVNSVQCVGIKVGKITVIHRLFPLVFGHFVVQNVLALLITY